MEFLIEPSPLPRDHQRGEIRVIRKKLLIGKD
jgi:hypothetical protein